MLWLLGGLVVGLVVLVWSADLFVDNSARLARRCGISAFLVGMFVVGFGTSLPELMVSFFSALEGNPSIALGNAYGSNIANILLILGVTAVISPIAVADVARKRDVPVLLSITIMSAALIADGTISRIDALIMLAFFIAICIRNAFADRKNQEPGRDDQDAEPVQPLWRMILGVIGGLVLLVGSSRLLVLSAVGIAKEFGVSDLIVGLTIVAIGTSLPELASSIAAATKREHDLALGNIVGSNFFNTLAVVGFAAVVKPISGADGEVAINAILRRDWPAMAFATLLLLIFCLKSRRGNAKIGRVKGIVFLSLYLAYVALLAKEVFAK